MQNIYKKKVSMFEKPFYRELQRLIVIHKSYKICPEKRSINHIKWKKKIKIWIKSKQKNGFSEQPKNNLKYGFLFDKPPLTISSASAPAVHSRKQLSLLPFSQEAELLIPECYNIT